MRTPYQSAYAWLVDAGTLAELATAGALVASLNLPKAQADKLRGYYRHFEKLTAETGVAAPATARQ